MGDIDKVRVLVVGDSGVGKTSLASLICHGAVLPQPGWTVGCGVEVKLHEYQEGTQGQKSYYVELWDIGGSHSQRNTRHVFYNTVHGIILVHDLANRKSCQNLGRWLAEVTREESGLGKVSGSGAWDTWEPPSATTIGPVNIPLLVIGTKSDLAGERGRLPLHQRRSDIAEEFGTEEIHLTCLDPGCLAAGSSAATKLTRFFDKVVERQYHVRDRSRSVNQERRRMERASLVKEQSPYLLPTSGI